MCEVSDDEVAYPNLKKKDTSNQEVYPLRKPGWRNKRLPDLGDGQTLV